MQWMPNWLSLFVFLFTLLWNCQFVQILFSSKTISIESVHCSWLFLILCYETVWLTLSFYLPPSNVINVFSFYFLVQPFTLSIITVDSVHSFIQSELSTWCFHMFTTFCYRISHNVHWCSANQLSIKLK